MAKEVGDVSQLISYVWLHNPVCPWSFLGESSNLFYFSISLFIPEMFGVFVYYEISVWKQEADWLHVFNIAVILSIYLIFAYKMWHYYFPLYQEWRLVLGMCTQVPMRTEKRCELCKFVRLARGGR